MSADVLNAGNVAKPEPGDGMPDLAEAILGYLLEIDGYRDTCLRCEGTAVVRAGSPGLEVIRYFARHDDTVSQLRSTIGRLSVRPSRNHHPFPMSLGTVSKSQAHDDSGPLLRESIVWENRAALVHVTAADADAMRLQVSLLFPSVEGDLPKMPLRMLADALLCHEFLIPATVATPLPAKPDATSQAVCDYLKRTMPRNLYASQGISNLGAG